MGDGLVALVQCKESRVFWSQVFSVFGIEVVMPCSGYDFFLVWIDYLAAVFSVSLDWCYGFLYRGLFGNDVINLCSRAFGAVNIIGYCIHVWWAFFKYKRRNVARLMFLFF